MKKLLLGLGTMTLAMLPIIAVASCSSTAPKSPLEMEVAKFNASFKAKDSSTTTQMVVDAINKPTDQSEKLLTLKTFVSLPEITNGFNVEVKLAVINSESDSSVDVKLNIVDTQLDKNSEATLVITNLAAVPPTLENEALKFTTPVVTTNPAITSSEAIATINQAANAEDKLKALQAIANVPKISDKFSMIVKSASRSTTKMAIDVAIQLTEVADDKNTKEVVLTITNFKEVTGTLSSEVAKLNTSVSTTVDFLVASDAVNQINNAKDETEKQSVLTRITNFPEIASSFTIKINTAKIVEGTPTSISVPITVTDPSLTTSNTGEATLTITNLWQHSIQSQVNKFGTIGTTSPSTTVSSAAASIVNAPDSEAKLAALKAIITVPTLEKGFTLQVISAFSSPAGTNLIVTLRIHQNSSISSQTRFTAKSLFVTGLKR